MNMEAEIANLAVAFKAHAEQDESNFAAIASKLENIATKEDVQELEQILKAARVTAGIFNFTFDNASKIGAFILFLVGLCALAKFGIFGAITWFFKTINGN